MKKLILVSLSMLMISGYTFSATIDSAINQGELYVVNICNLKEQELNEIAQGQRPKVAIEFTAQTTLPIHLFLKGDILNLVTSEGIGMVEIKQSFYARWIGEELVLSSNLVDWKPFLEFITGQATVTLGIQEGKPSFAMGAEINCRS